MSFLLQRFHGLPKIAPFFAKCVSSQKIFYEILPRLSHGEKDNAPAHPDLLITFTDGRALPNDVMRAC